MHGWDDFHERRIRIELRNKIVKVFSVGDLRLVCSDLGIDPDQIPGQNYGKVYWVNEVILYFERREELPTLLSELRKARPKTKWDRMNGPNAAPLDRWELQKMLYKILSEKFTIDDLEELCFVMGVRLEGLDTTTKESLIQSFIERVTTTGTRVESIINMAIERRPEMDELLDFPFRWPTMFDSDYDDTML